MPCDESVIDEHVCRLLLLAERVGALGLVPDAHRGLADRLARAATPPSDGPSCAGSPPTAWSCCATTTACCRWPTSGTVALIGRHGIETVCMGGGSAQVNPPYQVSIAEGLASSIGDRLVVVDGVEVRETPAARIAEPRSATP